MALLVCGKYYYVSLNLNSKIKSYHYKRKLLVTKHKARPGEPVRTGIGAEILFLSGRRKKRLQRPPVPVRTGIARRGAQKTLLVMH